MIPNGDDYDNGDDCCGLANSTSTARIAAVTMAMAVTMDSHQPKAATTLTSMLTRWKTMSLSSLLRPSCPPTMRTIWQNRP